jgi:hypothetical protein
MPADPHRIAMVTTVSHGTPWAELTTPNHAEYCLRHGYTFIARALPYDQAVRDFAFLSELLGQFDIVWSLDADAVVTNMANRVEDLPLEPGMNVCEENISTPLPRINCGSVVWVGQAATTPLSLIEEAEPQWKGMQWIWQQWVEQQLVKQSDSIEDIADVWMRKRTTVHPPRTFNSCDHGDVKNWQPGDFVYHPCGESHERRLELIREALGRVVR